MANMGSRSGKEREPAAEVVQTEPKGTAWRAAEVAKEEGDKWMRKGGAAAASEAYNRALAALEEVPASAHQPMLEELSQFRVELLCDASRSLLLDNMRGGTTWDSGSACSALDMLNEALEIDPTNAEAFRLRSNALTVFHEFQQALADLEYAAQLKPGHSGIKRELECVREDFRRWRKQATQDQWFRAGNEAKERGNWLFRQGQYWNSSLAYLRGLNVFEGTNICALSGPMRTLVITLFSNAAEALLHCNDIEQGTAEMATIMAGKVLQLQPHNIKALLVRGRAYCKANDSTSACRDFQQVLTLDPEHAAARQELQEIGGGSVQPFLTEESNAPQEVAAEALAVAGQFRQQGLWREGATAYTRGLRALEAGGLVQDPDSRGLWVALFTGAAEALLRSSAAEEFILLGNQALEIDSNDTEALHWRGRAYIQLQEFRHAYANFRELVSLKPADDGFILELAHAQELYELEGQLDSESGKLFDVILDYAVTDRSRGNRLFNLEQYEEAFKAYDQGIARFSKFKPYHLDTEARNFKTWLCCSAAQAALHFSDDQAAGLKLAFRTAEQALELEPFNVKALFRRGCAHALSGSLDLARNDFYNILVTEPLDSPQGQATVSRFQHFAQAELNKMALSAPEGG